MRGSKPLEILGSIAFKKVKRSYHSTPHGWRLATFVEAMDGLDLIKQPGVLNEWDRVRLLDGWITGAGYNFDMGNEFKGCLGYMLLIQTDTIGFAYADVNLSDSGKEVALFLCADDWNYEVVYWLLNSWSRFDTMKLADVREGNIPLINAAKFKEMNESIGHVARRLGDKAGAAREKARKMRYSGVDSVKDVLSGMLKCVTEEEEIVRCIDKYISYFTFFEAEEYCLPKSVNSEDVEEAFWSFLCDSFVGDVVEVCAVQNLVEISKMKKKSVSGNNFTTATRILLSLSDFRTDIIHESMAHNCKNSCAAKILSYAAERAGDDPHIFNEMLRKNGMWMCYDTTGNYGVLHKLLLIVAKAKKYDEANDEREKVCGDVVKKLLECGAEPERRYAIGKYKLKTSLQLFARFRNEDVGADVTEALLARCHDEQSMGDLVNGADDRGRTALHRASENGNARICQLLLERGASLKAQDEYNMTALHYALGGENDKVKDVLLKSPQVTESLDLKDSRYRIALDIAVTKNDYLSTAKLISKTQEPEAYLSKVDKEQLLRYSILVGSVNIVRNLFEKGIRLPAGECDDDERTVLHLAAMCDDEYSALQIITSKENVETEENYDKMVVRKDRRGRTSLHEAALKGHEMLCEEFLYRHPELIYVKDIHGQNPLYDAVRGGFNSTDLVKKLQAAYLKKDRPEDDLMDRSGLTPLHLAASEGKSSHVKEILSSDRIKNKYLSRGDMVGQTALHKAAKRGDIEILEILLKKGAHPLRERDCDGRTALHYAVQADIEDKRIMLVETLLKRCTEEEKSLLLWASAAGFGTAEQDFRNDDPLKIFLVDRKEKYKCNLLKTAASLGDIQMMKELLSRGYQMGDIDDAEWMTKLTEENRRNVKRVSEQIEKIKEQGNDKPATSDSLGRLDYAHGLGALFLNPYIKPPIAVGITGSWGMGKSSLMLQTERILLTTAAQMALLQSSKLSSSGSDLPDIKPSELSKTGKRKREYIYKHIKHGAVNRSILVILWDNLKSMLNKPSVNEVQEQLENFLNNEYLKHLKVFKALAAMDSSDMLKKKKSRSNSKAEEPSIEENVNVPPVLTVQYNAWKYRNDTEALAGLAVEVTRELEGIMTPAQWLNTCWRNNWNKKKYTILIEIFIPYFLAIVLAIFIAWIAWMVLGSEKFKEWGDVKYAWPPAAAVIIVWTLTRKVMGVLKPISSQLMQYMSAPDHTDKLGYQERVISDIKFLKNEIGEKPHWIFIVCAWIFATFHALFCAIFSVILCQRSVGKAMEAPKINSASGSLLRIIVFVDDLDRCDDSVILQVLSAVNLVLAVCEISVVLGMDKKLIESAILKKHGDQSTEISLIDNRQLAEMYLQKIIQLPLDLPDPSDEETKSFLRGQLGVLPQNENKKSMKDDGISSHDEGEGEAVQNNAGAEVEINVQPDLEMERGDGVAARSEINKEVSVHLNPSRPFNIGRNILKRIFSQIGGDKSIQRNSSPLVVHDPSPFILQREILFVSYSEGEEKAFLYFQSLATECRKLPREWKRLLNYHRLVWYIFSVSKEANKLTGWQVQLISWIFVCWEWQENMNFVIKKWKEIVKTSEPNGLSLLMIVEHLMEEHQRQTPETIIAFNAEGNHEMTEKSSEDEGSEGEGSVDKINNDDETKCSSTEIEELDENWERKKKATSKKMVKEKATSKKLKELERSFSELKEQMKELQDVVSSGMKKEIKELQKILSEQMKKDIKELQKDIKELQNQVASGMKNDVNEINENGKNEENREPKKVRLHNLENWERMKSALERYDVPMDSIQAFQRFRFYCIAGYLPLPS